MQGGSSWAAAAEQVGRVQEQREALRAGFAAAVVAVVVEPVIVAAVAAAGVPTELGLGLVLAPAELVPTPVVAAVVVAVVVVVAAAAVAEQRPAGAVQWERALLEAEAVWAEQEEAWEQAEIVWGAGTSWA